MKPGDPPVPAHLREGLTLLAAYLLSSGRRMLEEPADYAVYRLAEGARRALVLLESDAGGSPELDAVRADLGDLVHAPPAEHDLSGFFDALCLRLAAALPGPAALPDPEAEPAAVS